MQKRYNNDKRYLVEFMVYPWFSMKMLMYVKFEETVIEISSKENKNKSHWLVSLE